MRSVASGSRHCRGDEAQAPSSRVVKNNKKAISFNLFIHSSRAAAARWRWLWCSGHRGWGRNIAVHVRHLLLGLRLLRLLLLWRQEHRTGRQLCPRRHHDDHHLSHGRRCHARRCHAILGHHAVVWHRVRHHRWLLLLRLLWWHCVVSHRLWLWSRHIPPLLLLLRVCPCGT